MNELGAFDWQGEWYSQFAIDPVLAGQYYNIIAPELVQAFSTGPTAYSGIEYINELVQWAGEGFLW